MPVPDLTKEVDEELPEMPDERTRFPLPEKVRVLAEALVMTKAFWRVSVWFAFCAVIVALPVELVIEIVLLLVSVLPAQVKPPAFPLVAMESVPWVPKALLEPVLPRLAAVTNPLVMKTPPLKLFAVFESTRVEVPVPLEMLPDPLMTPESVPVRLVAKVTVKLFVRVRSLEMFTDVFTVPVPFNDMVGAVPPLLINSKAFPEMLKTGAVPVATPAPVKESLLSWKVPAMLLFEVAVALSVCDPMKSRVVSVALVGGVPPLQFVPAFH